MAKKQPSTRAARRAPAPAADAPAADGLFVVTTRNQHFDGVRAGVTFAGGRGLATAEQAAYLRDALGYTVAEATEADVARASETTDGDATDGDATGGDATDGDDTDGDATDGDDKPSA